MTRSLLAPLSLGAAPLLLLAAVGVAGSPAPQESGTFRAALVKAERAAAAERWDVAEDACVRALERDRKNADAWALRARVAAGAGDVDLQVYCLHQELRYLEAQGAKKSLLSDRRGALEALDAVAEELYDLRSRFSKKFTKVAEAYEKDDRPHGAIRVWKEVLALDPESGAAAEAIDRIASAPDPSLAGDAKPKDLFADVTDEWIAGYDAEHSEWKEAGRTERENYVTVTNAAICSMASAVRMSTS